MKQDSLKVAVLMTVYNRINKTLKCLNALFDSLKGNSDLSVDIYLTDDGSTDYTSDILRKQFDYPNLYILKANGSLYWNGGMNYAWKAALSNGKYDGYLWLNNDTIVFRNLWRELLAADLYALKTYGMSGIYIGSTHNVNGELTYGGFSFVNRWTLKDKFCIPNGTFQECQCGHGNVTYISCDVVAKMGILCEGYQHGGGDHDYTYLAYKCGFPVFVMRDYVGLCENDHKEDGFYEFVRMGLKERIDFLRSPIGFNLHNTLLFQKRCFPYRYPFVWLMGYAKALFPGIYMKIYRMIRK